MTLTPTMYDAMRLMNETHDGNPLHGSSFGDGFILAPFDGSSITPPREVRVRHSTFDALRRRNLIERRPRRDGRYGSEWWLTDLGRRELAAHIESLARKGGV